MSGYDWQLIKKPSGEGKSYHIDTCQEKQMSNNNITVYEPEATIMAVQDDFQRLCSAHDSVTWDAEKNFAIQQLYKNEYMVKVAKQSPVSVQNAVRNIAAIGLSLNPALKYAYLVPRNGEICLDVSYMGLMALAQDTGSVVWTQSKIVHKNDQYISNGTSVEPTHKYSAFGDRGEIIGAYCVVKLADGDFLTHEMSIEQIDAIRDRSESWKAYKSGRAKTGGAWQSDRNEMIKKTVVKQASKYWPKVERMNEAIRVLNDESGEGIDFEAERKAANEHYQWAQLLVSHMSNEDTEALLDEWESQDDEYQMTAWKHLSAPDRRHIKQMIFDERSARTIEQEPSEAVEEQPDGE